MAFVHSSTFHKCLASKAEKMKFLLLECLQFIVDSVPRKAGS